MNNGNPPDEILSIINPQDWDLIIVGDGSGSKYGFPGGWGAILFDNISCSRKLLYGSLNDTTVNVCELSPYIYSMLWYHRGPGRDLQKKIIEATSPGISPRPIKVHIISDCDIIVKQGKREVARDANMPLWWAMDSFESLNYQVIWHWIGRDNLSANRLCDYLSKAMRKATQEVYLPDPYDDQFSLETLESIDGS